MARYKGNAQLNTRVIRINLPAYLKLKSWCQQLDRSMADLIDYAVELLDVELRIKLKFALAIKPVPAAVAKAPLPAAVALASIPTMAINSSQAAAFINKSKGVRYD